METIANIGNVHDRARLADTAEEVKANLFATIGGEEKLRAWYIDVKMRSRAAAADGSMEWTRMAIIEGWLSFEDANSSELTAVAFAESVIRTLYADARATKLNSTVLAGFPGDIVDKDPRNFGGVVCSYVRVEMPLLTVETP